MVTSLRTDFIAAALVTNQIPRTGAGVCLQIGTVDGRATIYVPRTVKKIITSSLTPDGTLPFGIQRMMKGNMVDREEYTAELSFPDQRADDLVETPDESVDVVISLGAAGGMADAGMDWRKSIDEAGRVLKPGGRLLFVEMTSPPGDGGIMSTT